MFRPSHSCTACLGEAWFGQLQQKLFNPPCNVKLKLGLCLRNPFVEFLKQGQLWIIQINQHTTFSTRISRGLLYHALRCSRKSAKRSAAVTKQLIHHRSGLRVALFKVVPNSDTSRTQLLTLVRFTSNISATSSLL